VVRQVGVKNTYRLAAVRDFAGSAYNGCNSHLNHIKLVRDRWTADVTDFMEIDLAELRPDEGPESDKRRTRRRTRGRDDCD
jgi:hypothetical protein